MAAGALMIFLGRCIVSYYVVFHKQGPGLWGWYYLDNCTVTTIPPLIPP